MLLLKYAICDSKKSRCIKKQQGNGLLSGLGIRATLTLIPLLGNILF